MKTNFILNIRAIALALVATAACSPALSPQLSAQDAKKPRAEAPDTRKPKAEAPDAKKPKPDAKAEDMDHAKYMVADVTKSIKGMKIKDGTNLLNTSPGGLKLSAVVKGDRILRYVITDAKGNVIPSTHHKDPATAQAKATTCWECGVDAAGDRHCWKVPCPDIVGPWMVNASAVKSAQ